MPDRVDGGGTLQNYGGTTPEQDRIIMRFLELKQQFPSGARDGHTLSPEQERAEAEYGSASKMLRESGLPEAVIELLSLPPL